MTKHRHWKHKKKVMRMTIELLNQLYPHMTNNYRRMHGGKAHRTSYMIHNKLFRKN